MKENLINQSIKQFEETIFGLNMDINENQNIELLLDVNSQTSLRLKNSRIYELHKAMDGTQIGLDSSVVTKVSSQYLFESYCAALRP